MTQKKTPDIALTAILTDYGLMDDGEHKGRYAVRINDTPYPVLPHVDVFLVRLQKGVPVDILLKDVDGVQWINKIMKAKNPLPAAKPELTTAERMAKAGVGPSTHGPTQATETMSEAEADALKARGEAAAREKAHNAEMAAKSKEAAQKAAKERLARDEEMLRAAQQQGNNTDCTSPKDPEAKPDMDLINREAKEYQDKMRVENEARKAAQNPAPVTQMVPVTIVPPGYAVPKSYSSDEMILLRNVIAKDCTEPEFKMMMYMAGQYGLDPLLKQIWAVKRNEKSPAVIFVGRDGMLAIAHRSGQFDGMRSWVEYAPEDTGRKIPVVGHCEVWRKDMSHSFKTEVLFSEYEQPVPMSGYKGLWQTKPSVMIVKVAESVCLRKAFVVCGVYDPDEIPNGGA